MTVFGIAMVRDEADIIEHTVTKMLAQVDEVIVADNLSTDGTRDILDSLPVIVVDDPEPGYLQSSKMTMLAQLAAEKGATWVVPFDADEVWYAPFHESVADLCEELAPQWLTAETESFDHVATSMDNPAALNPLQRLGWRRRGPLPIGKVACRVREDLVINQGNHSATYDGGATVYRDRLVIRHFPYRSPEQMIRKVRNGAAAYAATDLPPEVGDHWRKYGALLESGGEEKFTQEVFRKWFYSADPRSDGSLIFDPAP